MPRVRRVSVTLAAVVALAAPGVAAESRVGPHVNVAVEPRADCPSEADFVAALNGALTSSSLDAVPPSRYEISYRDEEHGMRGTLLVTTEGEGPPLSRTVHASTCREAAEALALILVLIIDPLAAASPHFPEPAPPREPELPAQAPSPPPRGELVRPRAAEPTPVDRSRAGRLGAAVALGAATGILPGIAPAGDVSASFAFSRVPLELRAGGGFLGPKEQDAAGGTIRFWAYAAHVAVCGVRRTSAPTSLGICAGGSVHWVFTDARNFFRATTTNVVVPSATAGAFARYAFGKGDRWSVGLEVEAGLVLAPTTWNVLPAGDVHHTSTFTGRAAGVLAVELF